MPLVELLGVGKKRDNFFLFGIPRIQKTELRVTFSIGKQRKRGKHVSWGLMRKRRSPPATRSVSTILLITSSIFIQFLLLLLQREAHDRPRRSLSPFSALLHHEVLLSDLLRLQLDKVLGHLVVGSLREDAQDGPARLVHVDAPTKCQPAGARALEKQREGLC